MTWSVFLAALLLVESGGNMNPPPGAKGELGPYQISQVCAMDTNRIYAWSYSHEDMRNPIKARHVAIHYLRFYGAQYRAKTGEDPTPEVYARLWNGGPTGPYKRSTEEYGERFLQVYERLLHENGGNNAL
jgi:hypothetical protein